MTIDLSGKVAVVAASSRGLGRASAEALAAAGAAVTMNGLDGERLRRAADEVRRATGADVVAVPGDLRAADGPGALVGAAVERFGRLDVLVTNTGGPPPGLFLALDDATWYASFDLVFMSAVRLIRAAIPHLRRASAGGRIIGITGGSVKVPIPNLITSNSLRAGVTGLFKTLSLELAPDRVTVNTVLPGRLATDRVRELDEDRARREGRPVEQVTREYVAAIPLGRYGEPAELGRLVAFLASDLASYITGAAIPVDGGQLRTLL